MGFGGFYPWFDRRDGHYGLVATNSLEEWERMQVWLPTLVGVIWLLFVGACSTFYWRQIRAKSGLGVVSGNNKPVAAQIELPGASAPGDVTVV